MEPVPASPVARKVNREAVVLLGWGRAVLLQLAHPLVAAGVSDYSKFRRGTRGYLRRVRSTVGAMIELTFGTPDEAQRIPLRKPAEPWHLDSEDTEMTLRPRHAALGAAASSP